MNLTYDQGRRILHALRARASSLSEHGHTMQGMKLDQLADDVSLALLLTEQFPQEVNQ